ncbi:hypothetical protein NCS52_00708400 [Fusarium sp. LHS14.1]|nr:hypothetical protein NCS52_00708400 [Fusarium sp. LHS14.1]
MAYRGDPIGNEEGDEIHAELAGPKELTIYHQENLHDESIRRNLARPAEAVRVTARAGRLFLPKNKREAPAMKNRLVLQAPTNPSLLKGVSIGISGISLQLAFAQPVRTRSSDDWSDTTSGIDIRAEPCRHKCGRNTILHEEATTFVTGGPGAGKTTAAVAIVKTTTSHPVECHAVNENTETVAPEANGFALPEGDFTLPVYRLPTECTDDEAAETNADEGTVDTNAQVSDWLGDTDANADEGTPDTDAWPGETNPNAQNFTWLGEESGNDNQLHVWKDNNGSEAVIEAWTVGGTDLAVTSANLETSIAPAEPTMAQVSFLEQENDHTPVSGNRFEYPTGPGLPSCQGRSTEGDGWHRRLGGFRVQSLPWVVEMKSLRRAEDTVPKRTDVSIVPNASPASRQMAGHVDAIHMTAYGEKSPSAVFNSFSEFTRFMVQKNPTEWEDVERAWNEKLTDPTAYDVNRKTHEEAFQALVKAAAEAVDIVCSTPVTMVEFANKTTFALDFIVVNEAARLSENLSVAVQAKWPSAPCLLIGDTKQFPPMALAKQQKGFRAIFANQREISHHASLWLTKQLDYRRTPRCGGLMCFK